MIRVKCQNCGKISNVPPSRPKEGKGRYCSKECFLNANPKWKKGKKVIVRCKECGNSFEIYPSRFGAIKYCSEKCKRKAFSRMAKQRWESGDTWGDSKSPLNKKLKKKCRVCGKVFYVIPSRTNAKFCSRKCRDIGITEIMIGKMVGEKHPNWKGDKHRCREDITKLSKYKKWREEVFKRYGKICVVVGCNAVANIAHHIKDWKEYPELRFNPNNGLPLCLSHHSKYHNGKKSLKVVINGRVSTLQT